MPHTDVRLSRWADVPTEEVTRLLGRKLITGDQIMLAHLHLKKGCIVPRHSHHNEQLSWILDGALQFWVGDDEAEIVVRPGEVLHLPSNVPHRAEALEDTIGVDVFSPPRQDWLDGTDDYLRAAPVATG